MARRLGRFAGAVLAVAARAHFTLREVEDAGCYIRARPS